MAGVFKRSWDITKLSFDVIKKDKELLLFPLLAGIFSILFVIAMIFPIVLAPLLSGLNPGSYTLIDFFVFGIIYFGLAFIATFFNVCVVYTAKKRFEGGNATFSESIRFAFSKLHLIALWSLVSASVGILLRLIDKAADRMGPVGQLIVHILNSLLGAVWSIITLFVVPSMVYHELGPIDAIKKSVSTLKKTWGESLIRYYGLGIIEFIFIILGVLVGVMLFLTGLFTESIILMVLAIILAIVYLLFIIILFSVANTVFNTALFVYADKGKVPNGFSKEIMHNAFIKKPKKQ